MALLMAKTNTNLILSWIALVLCFPFGIPALVLAYSVRKLALKVRDDHYNFENLQEILLKCKKRANCARGLSIAGIVVSTLAAFAILIWWIVTNTNVQPADPADGSPFPSPFEG
ncbi:unnamed protein product [Oikopleura dioica]|nr:unnamed protein product [Oikopleura dioica]